METSPVNNLKLITQVQTPPDIQKKYIKNFLFQRQSESLENLRKLISKIPNQEFKLIYPDSDKEIELKVGILKVKDVVPLSEITDEVVELIHKCYLEQYDQASQDNKTIRQQYPDDKNYRKHKTPLPDIDMLILNEAERLDNFTLNSGIVGDFSQRLDLAVQPTKLIISNFMSDISYPISLSKGGNIYTCQIAPGSESPQAVSEYLKATTGKNEFSFILSPVIKLEEPKTNSASQSIFIAKQESNDSATISIPSGEGFEKLLASVFAKKTKEEPLFETSIVKDSLKALLEILPPDRQNLIPKTWEEFNLVCDDVRQAAFHVDNEIPCSEVKITNQQTKELIGTLEVIDFVVPFPNVSALDSVQRKKLVDNIANTFQELANELKKAGDISTLKKESIVDLLKKSIYVHMQDDVRPEVPCTITLNGSGKFANVEPFRIPFKAHTLNEYDPNSHGILCKLPSGKEIKLHTPYDFNSQSLTDSQFEALLGLFESDKAKYELVV